MKEGECWGEARKEQVGNEEAELLVGVELKQEEFWEEMQKE